MMGGTKAELYLKKASELEAKARASAAEGGATFMALAQSYRRLAAEPSSSLALASDAEIEALAQRMVDHPKNGKAPDTAV